MDTILLEFARQAPALAILAWIVSKFLEELREARAERKAQSDSCHLVHERSIASVDRCSAMLGRVESALDNNRQQTTDAVRDAFSGVGCPAVKAPSH